jgi:uncharacterized membrane protein
MSNLFPPPPWELHPALVHFPIAFLLGGVLLDLFAWWRQRPELARIATGLLLAGTLTGVVAALSGLLAFFTVPAHTEEAHTLMYWHLGLAVLTLVVFCWVSAMRCFNWRSTPTRSVRISGFFSALLLVAASALGGWIVYHGGAGIDPQLLSPEIRAGHSHGADHHGQAPEEHIHNDLQSDHHHK